MADAMLTLASATRYGLEKDTGMTDMQYDQGLAVFYATYIARFVGHSAPAWQEQPVSISDGTDETECEIQRNTK